MGRNLASALDEEGTARGDGDTGRAAAGARRAACIEQARACVFAAFGRLGGCGDRNPERDRPLVKCPPPMFMESHTWHTLS